jgi:DNA-binding transcriptional LysR family regulator
MLLTSSTLASLRYFAAAARLLSFKQAAAQLHVTQGAVSQQIKHLEGALGCELFHRLPRQIRLTAAGERFFNVVRQALQAIEQEAEALVPSASGRDIRVRAGPSFALHWLVPRLGDFYVRYPQIKLFVQAAYGDFDPARRDFDLAIELTRGKVRGLHCEYFMHEYLIPVCTPDYLARHPFLLRPSELQRCVLLHDCEPWPGAAQNAEWRHWLRSVGAGQVDSGQGQFFSLANMSIEAALNHQGVAMGRATLVEALLQQGHLVAPFKRRVKSPVEYRLACSKEQRARADLQVVMNWLREQAAGMAAPASSS